MNKALISKSRFNELLREGIEEVLIEEGLGDALGLHRARLTVNDKPKPNVEDGRRYSYAKNSQKEMAEFLKSEGYEMVNGVWYLNGIKSDENMAANSDSQDIREANWVFNEHVFMNRHCPGKKIDDDVFVRPSDGIIKKRINEERELDEINWDGLKKIGDFIGYRKGDGLIGNIGNIYGTMKRRIDNLKNKFNTSVNNGQTRVKLETIRKFVRKLPHPYGLELARKMGLANEISDITLTNFLANGGDANYPDIMHTLTSIWRMIGQDLTDSEDFRANVNYVLSYFKPAPATREALQNREASQQEPQSSQNATTGSMPTGVSESMKRINRAVNESVDRILRQYL